LLKTKHYVAEVYDLI